MKSPKPPTPEEFITRYGRRFPAAGPKHSRLRQMLEAALEDSLWREGETILTEHELARVCGLSVGTVQRAIRDLVASGDLRRVPGRGTFVTRNKYRLGEPFTNSRFLNDEGTGILPVRASLLAKRVVTADGPWMTALLPLTNSVLRIERLFDVNGEFLVLSRFHLDGQRFPHLANLTVAEVKAANLKLLLAKTYKLPTITHHQTIRLLRFPKEVCALIKRAAGTTGVLQSVTATIAEHDAVYYHELYIPPNRRALELPSTTL